MSLCKVKAKNGISLCRLPLDPMTHICCNSRTLLLSVYLPTAHQSPQLTLQREIQTHTSRRSQHGTLSTRTNLQRQHPGMSNSGPPTSHLISPHPADEFSNIPLSPPHTTRPDHQLAVPSLTYPGIQPSASFDVEAQGTAEEDVSGKIRKSIWKFRKSLSALKLKIHGRRLWAAVGVTVLLLLVIVVPLSLWPWGRY